MRSFSLVLLLFLGACGNSDEKMAKEVLGQHARNPESIQLRGLRRSTNGYENVLCGEWNGQNGFGGMGEWTRFAIDTRDRSLTMAGVTSQPENVLPVICDGKPIDYG